MVAFPDVFHHLQTPVVGPYAELCPSFSYTPCLSALVILSLQGPAPLLHFWGMPFPHNPTLAFGLKKENIIHSQALGGIIFPQGVLMAV